MKSKKYDTNALAAIAALNNNVGSEMWYQFYRDEYRCAGGRPELCAATLEKICDWFPGAIEYVPYVRYGATMQLKIRPVKKIEINV